MLDLKVRRHEIQANGLVMHVAEAGEGHPVVLCHGFPESWYSWRHQLVALAAAGFRAIAPDMRGYGGTEAPADVSAYSIFHLVGDMIGLLDAVNEVVMIAPVDSDECEREQVDKEGGHDG